MSKIVGLIGALVGALVLGAACGPSGTNCNCVATAACNAAVTETCGVGLVCCPPVADGGSN